MGRQNPFLFSRGKMSVRSKRLFFFSFSRMSVCRIPGPVVFKQVMIGAQEETPASAGRIHNRYIGDLSREFPVDKLAQGLFHDVIDDILGCVIHPSRLTHLGLFFDFHPQAFGKADDLSEELFVGRTENFHCQDREFVRTNRVIQLVENAVEGFGFQYQGGSDSILFEIKKP